IEPTLTHIDVEVERMGAPVGGGPGPQLAATQAKAPELALMLAVVESEHFEAGQHFVAAAQAVAVIDDAHRVGGQRDVHAAGAGVDAVLDALQDRLAQASGLGLDQVLDDRRRDTELTVLDGHGSLPSAV